MIPERRPLQYGLRFRGGHDRGEHPARRRTGSL